MRTKLLILTIAAALAAPATSSAAPTLTVERDCSRFPTFHGVTITLSGFPPDTPFTGTVRFPEGGGVGPAELTTDAAGSYTIGFGSEEPGTFTVTVEWSGGTLQQSLSVNCEQQLPTRKEDCKNGGWKRYGVFRNQGDCVSYVATGGKNPPSGRPAG
jgi:hypothetical protein